MKFTTPCFVRVEDAEKRKELTEWLKGIGYYVCSCCLFDGCNTLHCRGIDRLKIAYEVHGICDYDEETRYSIGQFKAENAESRNPSYDCGENVELFKALAAMNDENDREQWFIAEEAKAWVNQGLYAPIGASKNACWSIGSVSPPVRPRLRRLSNISKRGRNDTSKILYQIQRLR